MQVVQACLYDIHNLVQVVEDLIACAVLADVFPDMFGRVQVRRVGRQWKQSHVGWNNQFMGLVPPGAVQQHHAVFAGKLSTLGVDNRSTATTILAVRSLIELQGDRNLKADARKLFSFTDNRQDASLQAGHFNDFAQVALLRSALHKATEEKGATGVRHGELSRSVFDAMQLRFDEYAADPESLKNTVSL